MDQLETREIAVADRASAAFFSPDSRWLAFLQDGVLKRVPVADGAAVEIAALPELRSASWGEGGNIVFQRRDGAGLFVIPASGGESRQLTSPDVEGARHTRPSALPGGRAVVFTIVGDREDEPQIALADLGTGEVRTLIRGEAARYVRGHLIYNQTDGSLVVQPFDPRRGVLTGAPVALPDRVEPRMFDVSESGLLVYLLRGREEKERLVFYDGGGRIRGELRPELGDYEDPRIAPDGRRVAFALRGESGPDVWIYDSQRETASRLTFDGSNRVPVWTPDGDRIAYRKGGEGRTGLYWKRADGSGEEERLLEGLANPGSFTPDGKSLILAGPDLGQPPDTSAASGVSFTTSDLRVLSPEPPGELTTFLETPYAELHPALSPDGRWLAYRSNESGQSEVYLRSFPDAEGPWQVSTGGGGAPVWSPDGGELYFVSAGQLTAVRVTVDPGGSPTFGAAERLFEASPDLNAGNPNYDVDRDGRFLMIQRPERESIAVVLNWLEAARRIADRSR